MISDELLALLRCPETKQPLTVATSGLIAQLETLRAAGHLLDCTGNPCTAPVEAGLVRSDGTLFFPIRDGIPVMIVAEAVPLPVVPR